MKYLSLFSGIGGFELGIQKAYESIYGETKKELAPTRPDMQDTFNENEGREQATCIGFSEIDKYAIEIYKKHFPNHKPYGDITKINATELPDFDLLVGGFPCQSFSIAGKRGGFNDTRGTLFFEIARILRDKRPRYLVLENVKGLLSHDSGKTFSTILGVLTDIGYDCQWQVLNSKNFGVPQNRERVFIVGHLRGFGGRQVFPIGEGEKSDIQPTKELPVQISNTLRTNYSNGFSNETYTEQDFRIRRLTPVECARLQGFPDDWHKIEGISDTQAYKCYGNAVTVNVVEEIIKRLF